VRNRVLSTFGIAVLGFGAPWLVELGFKVGSAIIVLSLICSVVSLFLACTTIVKYRTRGLWTLLVVPLALYWPVWLYVWG